MNAEQLKEPTPYLELEELELWEPADFDDMLKGYQASELDNELTWDNSNFGLDSIGFQ